LPGVWRQVGVEDALRLAELIYLSLDDPARVERRLELVSTQLVVFLSE